MSSTQLQLGPYAKCTIAHGGKFCCEKAAHEWLAEDCRICGDEDCDCGCDMGNCDGLCKHWKGDYKAPEVAAAPLVFGIQDAIDSSWSRSGARGVSKPTFRPRPLDEASEAQEPTKKKKRKAAAPRPKKLTAVKKTMNGKIFYEISLPDGSVVLTSVLEFSS